MALARRVADRGGWYADLRKERCARCSEALPLRRPSAIADPERIRAGLRAPSLVSRWSDFHSSHPHPFNLFQSRHFAARHIVVVEDNLHDLAPRIVERLRAESNNLLDGSWAFAQMSARPD